MVIIIIKVGALRVVLDSDLKSVTQCAQFLERVAVLFTVNDFIADTITQSQELSKAKEKNSYFCRI
jgi:hypothetical protein